MVSLFILHAGGELRLYSSSHRLKEQTCIKNEDGGGYSVPHHGIGQVFDLNDFFISNLM